jgi:hypothetical protein
MLGAAIIGAVVFTLQSHAADTPAIPHAISLTADRLTPGATVVTPGSNGSLRLAFPKTDWPSLWFSRGKAYPSADWSNVGGIALTLRNPDKAAPLPVNVRVDDSPLADGKDHCRTGSDTLAPGETATLVFPMSASAPGMNAGPPLLPGNSDARLMTAIYGPKLDEKNIVAFQIFLAQPGRARDLDVLSVRLLPKPELIGIVDRFGQYSKADWPGKIHDEADLRRAADAEKAWLAAHPPPADRDEYGGWKSGPTLKATGFFRTALLANGKERPAPKPGDPLSPGSRWWLVTPTGHLFWSAGVTCVRPYFEAPLQNKESMYTYLPDDMRKRGQADFFFLNLRRRFPGEDWQRRWADETATRMKSWGFNTVANWSDPAAFRAKVPYVVAVGSGGGLPDIAAKQVNEAPGPRHYLPDYFDDRFPQAARTAIARATAEYRKDPWCLGYFVDNELAWDTWAQMGTGGEYVVAREALSAPATLAARRAFVALLRKKYATPAEWGKAWGITVAGWDAPLSLKASDLNAAARQDCSAFSTVLAERYFSVVRAALKAEAPDQLYLGCRFAIRPREMVEAAARYCDVVSFNIYADTVEPATWGFTERLGKPAVIGEFHFGATDRGLFHPGLRPRKNQKERAASYEAYVRSVRALPAFVGCHWFQWADEPLTGRFDGENYNIGFVTVADTVYPEMRDAARRVNAALYKGTVPPP